MWEQLAPRLEGSIVVLEPLRPEHLDALFEVARPPEIWDWWPLKPATDRERFEEWFEQILKAVADGSEIRFATLDARTGGALGMTSFCTLRPEHRGLEIGWTWLTPSAWGTGANTDAKLLQLRYAFEELGCQRVEFETDELNGRSRAALAALGAQQDGVLRDWRLLPSGIRGSSVIYSIIDLEWPSVARNLEQRVRDARQG